MHLQLVSVAMNIMEIKLLNYIRIRKCFLLSKKTNVKLNIKRFYSLVSNFLLWCVALFNECKHMLKHKS